MYTDCLTPNRLTSRFATKKKVLSIYFTAGYPHLHNTVDVLRLLQKHGADMVEIGMPFSDSLLDGPVIQHSHQVALQNGMSLAVLFEQLREIRKEITIPLLLMGSINQVYQYGIEKFCQQCQQTGIDGVILPDLPLEVYIKEYQEIFTRYNVASILMVSPQTAPERLRQIDTHATGFIYLMSSNSTTGNTKSIQQHELYFQRIQQAHLRNPLLIGFNVNRREDFELACTYADGAIIGSAFVKVLAEGMEEEAIRQFLQMFRQY